MRKIVMILAAFATLTACSEDAIESYQGTPMVNVGFMVPNSETGVLYETQASQFVNFVENPDWTEQNVKFRVSISDIKRDYDRTVYLKYNGDFNSGTQTKLPKSVVIPANKVSTDLELTFVRPEKADEMRDNQITVTTESKDGLMPGVNAFVVVDISLFPSTWVCKNPSDGGFWAEYSLGTPSKVKNKILTDLFGTFVMDPKQGMAPDFGPYKTAMTEYVQKYNEDPSKYNNKYGSSPMKDENGKIIKIG